MSNDTRILPDAIAISAFENTFGVKHDSSWRAASPGWSYATAPALEHGVAEKQR